MTTASSLLLFIAAAALGEYAWHRLAMHGPRIWMRLFVDHHVRHHVNGDNRATLDLPAMPVMIATVPLWIPACWMTPAAAATWCGVQVAAAFAYARTWSKLHRAIHGIERNWTQRLPGYAAIRRHHEAHHVNPYRNFATVFLFTDRLFGTLVRRKTMGSAKQ